MYVLCLCIGLDIPPLSDEASGSYQTHLGRSHLRQTPEPLDGILSPELDKMVTDGLYTLTVCIL